MPSCFYNVVAFKEKGLHQQTIQDTRKQRKQRILKKKERKWKMRLFERKGPGGFTSSSTADEVTLGIDGSGFTAIVTGERPTLHP